MVDWGQEVKFRSLGELVIGCTFETFRHMILLAEGDEFQDQRKGREEIPSSGIGSR